MNTFFIFSVVFLLITIVEAMVYIFLLPKLVRVLWWRYIPMSGYVLLFLHKRGKLFYLIQKALSIKAQKEIRKDELRVTENELKFWGRVKQKTIDCFRIITNKQYILIEVEVEENTNDKNELTIAIKAWRYRMTEEMMFICMNRISHEIYGRIEHNQKVDELIRNINNDSNPNMN